MTWVLSPEEFQATAARVEKINARAVKRGFTGRIEISGRQRELTETDRYGLERTRLVIDTDLAGTAPCYEGWQFIAAVDAVETQDGPEVITRRAPGVDEAAIDRSLLAPGQCQHCNTRRANRRHTYLVRNSSTGQQVQVGATCLKDFLGWDGHPVFIDEDAVADEIDGGLAAGPARPAYTPSTVIAAAWAAVKTFGWAPSSFSGTTTRDIVTALLYGLTRADRELAAQAAARLEEGMQKAPQIIAAIQDAFTGESEYEANMLTALRLTGVDGRHLGLIVSAVNAYERILGIAARKTLRKNTAAASRYAGTVGDKITLTGTVTGLHAYSTYYGHEPTLNVIVILEAGTTVCKIATAARWARDIDQGDQITVAGTVHAHTEYHGTKQTVLKRAKRINA